MKKFISTLLVVAILCTMIPFQVVIAADTDILYTTQRTEFVISEANGANAKMFMLLNGEDYNKGEDYSDFYLGLDYLGYLKYGSDNNSHPTGTSADVLDDHYGTVYTGALVYTIDGTDNNNDTNNTVNLTTKNEKLYWNINGVDYLINPNEKAIKLYTKVKTDNITDTELAARFNSLNEVTFNIEDGNYTEIGFLAACGSTRKLTVTLVYDDQDGSKSVEIPMSKTDSNAKGQSKGAVSFQDMNTHKHAGRKRTFAPYTVSVDNKRVLKEVMLKSNSQLDEIIIISAWGENPSVKSMLDKVPDPGTLTEDNIADAKKALAEFEEYIQAIKITYEDLDAEMKAKVDALRNAEKKVLANKINELDENAEITADNIYLYKEMLSAIEKYAKDNSLEFTVEQETKIKTITSKIETAQYKIVADDVNGRIEELPAIDDINVDNFRVVTAKVKEIEDIINEYGIKQEDIADTNKTMLEEIQKKLSLVIADVTVIIPLNIQDGANVKLFLEQNETDADCVPWVDYIPQSYISATISSPTPYTPIALRYSETEPSTTSLINAPNKIWTVNNVPFKIGNDVLGIRLHGNRTVSTGDTKLTSIMNSYGNVTINLEKGFYSNLHILAANPHGNTGDPEADITYVLKYKDGTTVQGGFGIQFNPKPEKNSPEYGYVLGTNIEQGASGSNTNRFADYVIETDPEKQLDTINFTCKETQRIVYIAGISGETAKLSSIKTAIMDRLSYSIPAIGTSSKDVLLEIEDLVKEYESAGADADMIDGISKFNQDIATYYQGEFSLDTTRVYTDLDNSYFEATFSKNIKVPENVVAVKKGKDYLTSDKFTMSVEGKTLKIVIPDNHKEIVTYTIEIAAGVLNADNQMFNTYKASSFEFKSEKAVSIDKFELVDGTVNVTVTNNMSEKTQDYVLVIGAYNSDNKKVGMKIVCGTLDKKSAENSTIQAALNASEFADGVKIECYLADRMNTLKYLDRAEPIVVAVQ